LRRVLALDYGSARCGCAVSDPTGTLSTPLPPIERPGSDEGVDRIAALVREQEAERVVVGLPVGLSGTEGPQAQETRRFVERLQGALEVPVETWDERFTTRLAQATPGRHAEDSRAAAHLLQSWLEARRT
jgi:putative transcription antitermination factor YqgF